MATAKELLARTADIATEPHIVIGSNRVIEIPSELRTVVQFDHNVETVVFDCPRYWDEHDMSVMKVVIDYTRSDKVTGQYICSNVWVNPDDDMIMHFSWTIDGHVSAVVGPLSIQVVVKDADENGDLKERWGSITNADMRIEPSLNASAAIADSQPDVVLNILSRLDELESNGIQSDWGANENEPGHVRNRTHYVETTNGDTIIETANITFRGLVPANGRYPLGYALYINEVLLIPGRHYVVTLDSDEYVCVCQLGADGTRYLGNASLVDTTSPVTSERFYIYNGNAALPGPITIWHENPNITAHIVGIHECAEFVHKLDGKFIDAVKSINGIEPDENGNVDIEVSGGEGGGTQFETDETLRLENGVLSVNTTDQVEEDNTLPITSAGVYAIVGNVEELLKTI